MSRSSTAVACLIVPSGVWDLRPLVDSIRATTPSITSVAAVWCGDPHLRPVAPTDLQVAWADLGLDEPTGLGWNRLLVALEPQPYEWARAAAAIARLLDGGAESVLALRVGSVAVLGDLAAFTTAAPISLLARIVGAMPDDSLAPTEADVIESGRHSTAAARFGDGAQPALQWLGEQLIGAEDEVGPWFDRLGELFGAAAVGDPQFVTVGWSPPLGTAATMLDLSQLDRDEPWHITFASAPARSRLSADACLAADVADGLRQCVGLPAPVLLPGAIPVDGPIRTLMRSAIRAALVGGSGAPLPPEPFGHEHSIFTTWLESSEPAQAEIGRYWLAVRDGRPDLQTIFPQPQAASAAGLREWADASWRLEHGTALLRPHAGAETAPIISAGHDPAGVNVLGYLNFDQSQGHIAREIIACLEAAAVPVAPLNHRRSQGAPRPTPFTTNRSATYATNLVVVNADQFLFVAADHGDTLLRDRHTIGYWFWELEHVTVAMVRAIDDVDEIWTGSEFVADAFRAVTNKPVHCVPLPVAEPQPSDRDRASFGLPDDRFVFVTTFDQFSVPERKNPFGVIEAFTRAFVEDEGPILWIKTMNGDRGWRNYERLLLAAAGRRDIMIFDGHLSRADQMAVLNISDCLVSLHRSEGLGLHCAEAMWLSKPVIATRYSGNLDFMDDTCAALIDFDLVPVRHGDGIYPAEAMWAEPDLAQAASWMRRLSDDSALAAGIGHAAYGRMHAQTSAADAGHLMARLARLHPAVDASAATPPAQADPAEG